MAKQRSGSPNTRQIVRSFLDFLNSIELTSDEDTESVEVASECLRKAFGLDLSSTDEGVPHGLLDLFIAWEAKQPHKLTSGSNADLVRDKETEDSHVSATVLVEGKPKQELLGRLSKLSSILSKTSVQAAKAAQLFNEALAECLDQIQIASSDEISDLFKSKGNQAMQSRQYAEVISHCKNREAAYIQLKKNLKALKVCLKKIELDPKNSEPYRRLGLVYVALGKYHKALTKGFLKALKLDPDNQTIQEFIEMTISKLIQERQKKILALCNPSQFGSFSNGSNRVNPEFLSDSADEFRDLAKAFLDLSCELNSDSRGSSEVKSDNVPVANVIDVLPLLSPSQIFAEQGGPHGAGSQGF